MILEITDLKKVYGNRTVVNIPSLSITEGETIGLVGNNGAGKTTLFRMMLDLIRPDEGLVLSRGVDVSESDAWKKYTASYLDEGFLIDYLTAEEYFLFVGSLHNINEASVFTYLEQYQDFFNGEILKKNKYIRDFSKGNQNKIGIAAGLMQNPDLLILDEPFANLDPTTQIRLKTLLKSPDLKQRMTTLISSHDLNHVTEVCDRIILLEKGVVIKDFMKDENTLRALENYFSA
ncbi:ABC transporter ATP-binding protein [Pedobacter faecalis]|uniref:ABC transporter ATP-binding protein n=1 Tax=Pedobacter faecalis TaxID=3041495 RepID=UPI0025516F0C|nr:ABC transporter ATP-binding protein [Pedobacter sp. ELA7]